MEPDIFLAEFNQKAQEMNNIIGRIEKEINLKLKTLSDLKEEIKELNNNKLKTILYLQNQIEQLNNAKEKFSLNSNDIIKLNVGGTIFTTKKETLLKEESIFKILMQAGNDNEYFFDRDPKHFLKILNFFRDKSIIFPTNEEEIQELNNEIEFYQIKKLKNKNRKFKYSSFFDKKGIVFFLGSQNMEGKFVNPLVSGMFNVISSNKYYNQNSDYDEKTLNTIFDYYIDSKDKKKWVASTNTEPRQFIIDFLDFRINISKLSLANMYGNHLDYLPNDLKFYGSINNINWVQFSSKKIEENEDGKTWEFEKKEIYIKYLKILNEKFQIVLSGCEIYGILKEID